MKCYITLNWYCFNHEFLEYDNAKNWLVILKNTFPNLAFELIIIQGSNVRFE